ncbi:Subversion of eukaryotic traffic protein A [Kalymmatonema gypsitolerans NIES-4073]|nr:Subversion of eukaryotic traffic protein A [Scytonema sp. NIES-4073]
MLKEQLEKYYVDFDVAMGKGSGYFRQIQKYTGLNREYFNFFKDLYQKNHFLKVQPQENPKIPKIIHQIWIGNRNIPKKLHQYQQTWIEHHPGWEYKLWTNEEVKKYSFVNNDLKFLFDQALTLGERVDVLRYDILYQYGGIYADCDCICLKPFDVFAYSYDFFAGIFQPMFAKQEPAIFLQNCLIGVKPKHPIIRKLSSLLLEKWEDVEYKEDEIYTTLKRTFLGITLAVISEGGKDNNIDIVMPPSYFFPLLPYPLFDIMIRGIKDTILGMFLPELNPYSSFKYYSFSNHYSSKEWMKDIYSTLTFNHDIWTVFNLKDWMLFLKSKMLQNNTHKKLARQTFEELLSH